LTSRNALLFFNAKYRRATWLKVMKGKDLAIEESGFTPAFLDTVTNLIIVCRKCDGSVSNVHVLSGLPESILLRDDYMSTLSTGYERDGEFYTREEAYALLSTTS